MTSPQSGIPQATQRSSRRPFDIIDHVRTGLCNAHETATSFTCFLSRLMRSPLGRWTKRSTRSDANIVLATGHHRMASGCEERRIRRKSWRRKSAANGAGGRGVPITTAIPSIALSAPNVTIATRTGLTSATVSRKSLRGVKGDGVDSLPSLRRCGVKGDVGESTLSARRTGEGHACSVILGSLNASAKLIVGSTAWTDGLPRAST
mmetsp:Transcript_50720/g.133417  ORF Transcript_50720/g.133417 Transcript_50720/m.133417 type:complete len:206 (-) Transcript_50720:12-629(-)